MSRDIEGGISLAAQEDQARAQQDELQADAELRILHASLAAAANAVEAWPVKRPSGMLKLLWWACAKGVKAAESHRVAERILEQEQSK